MYSQSYSQNRKVSYRETIIQIKLLLLGEKSEFKRHI